MKIFVVQDGDWTKKGPHQQHHLIEKLSVKGHKIVVIGYDHLWREEKNGFVSQKKILYNTQRFYKGANITFIRAYSIKLPLFDYLSFLFSSKKEIKRSIEEFKPDIVIGFTSLVSSYWGMRFARKRRIPYIDYWTDITHRLVPFKPFRLIAKLIEREIIKNSEIVLAINESLRDYTITMGANLAFTQVITGGIDFDRFNPSIDTRPMRTKYNISEDELVLFFMGWIYEFSGLKEVVLELSKNKGEYPNLKLLVVGEGDYYSRLREIVKQTNMEDHVILTGKRPYEEIPQLIAAADICLLPAYNNEIMRSIVPIKMYEYLAMHKPVISTKLEGVIKEFGYHNGVIYVDRPEDIVEKVNTLSNEDIQINKLRAKEFIKSYSWDEIVTHFERVLESVSNGVK